MSAKGLVSLYGVQNKQIYGGRRGGPVPQPVMPELGVGAVGKSSYSSVWLVFGIDFHFLQPLFS